MAYAPAPAPGPYGGQPAMGLAPAAPVAPVSDPGKLLGAAWTMWGLGAPGGAAPPPAPAPPGYPQPVAAAPAAPAWPAVPTTIPWTSIPALPGLGIPGAPSPAAPAAPGWSAPVPGASGRPAAWEQLEQEVFVETNARRARGAVCAGTTFPPAPPLVLHAGLQKTARDHALDMANRNYFEHKNPEGQGPGPRGRANGYHGVFTGENIAAQARTAVEVVDLWMSSTEGHCHNIMDARYKNFGAGYAENAASTYQRYWAQNFGP